MTTLITIKVCFNIQYSRAEASIVVNLKNGSIHLMTNTSNLACTPKFV